MIPTNPQPSHNRHRKRSPWQFPHEINWQDGDIAVLDNTRIMHGRRAIVDTNRQLFIGMGNV